MKDTPNTRFWRWLMAQQLRLMTRAEAERLAAEATAAGPMPKAEVERIMRWVKRRLRNSPSR